MQLEDSILVQIEPEIISAKKARQQANGWLAIDMGHLLRAENPKLRLNASFQLRWRLDIVLTSANGEPLETLGQLELDAVTGQPFNDSTLRSQLINKAYEFTAG